MQQRLTCRVSASAIVVGDGVAAGGVAGVDVVARAAGPVPHHRVLCARASLAVADDCDCVVCAGRRRLRIRGACVQDIYTNMSALLVCHLASKLHSAAAAVP